MTYYCTNCWKEIDKGASVCPACGSHQEQLGQESFVQKLIRALQHPEPETPIRAAYVLGELKATEAIPELKKASTEATDPFVRAAAIRALGAIDEQVLIAFTPVLLGLELSIVERAALREALHASGSFYSTSG
jgi:HEAT repeat protein